MVPATEMKGADMERVLVVDCGKLETKVIVRNPDGSVVKRKFPTKIAEANELTAVNKGMAKDLHIVEYEGRTYSVGDPEGTTSDSNSKKDMVHKIVTLAAIAMNVNMSDSVKVAIGCPLSVFMDPELREEYMDYILPKGQVEITVDGNEKRFYISYRMCLAESLGAMYMFPERFRSSVVGVVDVGGLNINCSYFNSMKLVADSCFTDKYGMRHILGKVRSRLNQALDVQLKMFEVEHFVNGDYSYVSEADAARIREIVDAEFEKNLLDIEKACKENSWNMSLCRLIFIGGTSQVLKERIVERYGDRVFIPDGSEYVNAEGFMRGLCMKLRIGV